MIMEPTEYPAMSGSNSICTTTVLLETGMVEMREPVTAFRLEAPGGAVEITAGCRAGKRAALLQTITAAVLRVRSTKQASTLLGHSCQITP